MWILLVATFFLLWRVLMESRLKVSPRWWLHWGLQFLMVILVMMEYGLSWGLELSTSLVIVLSALKLFELKQYRDYVVVVFICHVLLLTRVLAAPSIALTFWLAIDVVLILSALVALHLPQITFRWRTPVTRSMVLLLQALPLVVISFLVFPRFTTGWLRKPETTQSKSGFSEELRPGSVEQLLKSSEVVFRARFPVGEKPPVRQMYWRGLVLTENRGYNWSLDTSRLERSPPVATQSYDPTELIKVEVILEPSDTQWLFTPEYPVRVTFQSRAAPRLLSYAPYVFRANLTGAIRQVYQVETLRVSRQMTWDPPTAEDLQVGEEPSARLNHLLESWRKQDLDASSVRMMITDFYLERGFVYSLSPKPTLSVDDFLFSTREGFCEHFAGAAAYIFRLMSIPSRVVIGYQGGEDGGLNDYVLVRSQDAHAWVEYWDERYSRWERYDPTSHVSPIRIDLGSLRFIEESLAASDFNVYLGQEIWKRYIRARLVVDQFESAWISFLIRFDRSRQRQMLRDWGFHAVTTGTLWSTLFGFTAFFVILFALWRWWAVRPRRDPLDQAWQRFLRKLIRRGFKYPPSRGVLELRSELERYSNPKSFLLQAVDTYVRLKYAQNGCSREELSELKHALRQAVREARSISFAKPNSIS